MNPNKALWEKGDFTRIADSMRESGEALVAKLGITKGMKVLDLGCNFIGDSGARALAESVALARLERLDLFLNGVGVRGRRALTAR